MNITLRQLEIFEKIVSAGGHSRAAEALHLSQPAVSMQLKQLTETVGMPLLFTQGRHMQLTEAGEMLYQTCLDMAQRWDRFEQSISALQGLQRGRLRLATVSTAKYFFPRLLGPFCQQHPEIEVALDVANRDRILERLQQGLDDFVIMSIPPTDSGIEPIPFLENPLVAIAPLNHPWAKQKQIELSKLATTPFVIREQGSGTRIAIERWANQHELSLNVRFELASNEAIKEAVAGGLGVSIISRHALHAEPQQDGLAILPIRHLPIQSEWFIVHWRERPFSPVALAFLAYLKNVIPEYRAQRGLVRRKRIVSNKT